MSDVEERLRAAFREHDGARLVPTPPDPGLLRRARRGRFFTSGLALVVVVALVGVSFGVVRSLGAPSTPAPADRIVLPTGDTATIVGQGPTQDGREWRVVMLTGGAWAATSPGGVLARLELRTEGTTDWQPIEVERFSKIGAPIDEVAGFRLSDQRPGVPWSTVVWYGVVRGDVSVTVSPNGGATSSTLPIVPLPRTGSTITGAFTLARSSEHEWTARLTDDQGNVWGHPFTWPTATDRPLSDPGLSGVARHVVASTTVEGHTYGVAGYLTAGADDSVECALLRQDGRAIANRCTSTGRAPQVWSFPASNGGWVVFGTFPNGYTSLQIGSPGPQVQEVGNARYFVTSTTDPCDAPFVFEGPAGRETLPSAQDCPLPGGA
jgi:hypothetical protein